MKTVAILFAPAQYEDVLGYRIKGVPFFLYTALKFAGITGIKNVIIASDSSHILQLALQYGFGITELPPDSKPGFDIRSGMKQLFTGPVDCFISAFAGMPHFTAATIREGIAKIEGNNDMVITSSVMVEGMVSNIFSRHHSETGIRLPLSFMGANSDQTGPGLKTATIVVSPLEAQVYLSTRHLAGFAESEDCISFFRGLSAGILKMLHPYPVKMLLLDIDGVLTDGGMYYTESGDEFKKFDTKDGLAIKMLTKKGFDVGFISAGKNKYLIESRAKLLGVQHCYVGFEPKLGVLDTWLRELGYGYENVLYVGDDLVDLDIFNAGVLAACPADAVNEIKAKAKIILSRKGGEGCVRELVDNYMLSLRT